MYYYCHPPRKITWPKGSLTRARHLPQANSTNSTTNGVVEKKTSTPEEPAKQKPKEASQASLQLAGLSRIRWVDLNERTFDEMFLMDFTFYFSKFRSLNV